MKNILTLTLTLLLSLTAMADTTVKATDPA